MIFSSWTVFLSLAVLVAASGAVLAHYASERRVWFIMLKPLTTILILVLALASLAGSSTVYTVLIAAGLGFSLLGDVSLMVPSRGLLPGLVSFSVTHVLYLSAWMSAAGVKLVNPFSLLLGLAALALVRSLWGQIRPSLRGPVLVYAVLIAAMGSQAIGAAIVLSTIGAALAAIGAVLFFVSDTVLALDRFGRSFTLAQAVILCTYWSGQWLIALSTVPGLGMA